MKTILVCDDDRGILEMMETLLEMNGYKVILENGSNKVIESVQLHNPDIIIMDLWMPGLGGDVITKKLKNNPGLKHIPVILFSASSTGRSSSANSGADYFIEKPFNITELIVLLKKISDLPIPIY